MRRTVARLVAIGAIALMFYLCGWVLFLDGITDIVHGAASNSADKLQMLWGLVQMFVLAPAVAWFIFWAAGFTILHLTKRVVRVTVRSGPSNSEVDAEWQRIMREATEG